MTMMQKKRVVARREKSPANILGACCDFTDTTFELRSTKSTPSNPYHWLVSQVNKRESYWQASWRHVSSQTWESSARVSERASSWQKLHDERDGRKQSQLEKKHWERYNANPNSNNRSLTSGAEALIFMEQTRSDVAVDVDLGSRRCVVFIPGESVKVELVSSVRWGVSPLESDILRTSESRKRASIAKRQRLFQMPNPSSPVNV